MVVNVHFLLTINTHVHRALTNVVSMLVQPLHRCNTLEQTVAQQPIFDGLCLITCRDTQLHVHVHIKHNSSIFRRAEHGLPDVKNVTSEWEVISDGGHIWGN